MNDLFSPDNLRVAWLVLGVVLIGAELLVPGAVIGFFGAGAILTGIGTALGWLPGPGSQLLFWMVSSFVLVAALRGQVVKWFPPVETYQPPDEHGDIVGRLVDVLVEVHPDNLNGRVRYQGTTWTARSSSGVIPVGSKAKISGRDDLLIYVEPVES